MQIENQTCAYLLVLLRCALTGAPAPAAPEGLDFDAFFDLARRQQVYNIVFPLLAALPGVPEGEKKRWENYAYTELTAPSPWIMSGDGCLPSWMKQALTICP